jgi:hypothetical protein
VWNRVCGESKDVDESVVSGYKPKLLELISPYDLKSFTFLDAVNWIRLPVKKIEAETVKKLIVGFCILLCVYPLMLFHKTTVRNNVFCARFYCALLTTYDQRSTHTSQPILQIKQGGPKIIHTL